MRDLRRAALRCFAPACGGVILSALVFSVLQLPRMFWAGVAIAALEVTLMIAGYVAVLALGAPWLPAHRRFATARSVLAGVMAPLLLGALAFGVPRPAPTASIAILSVAAGVLVGLVLWLPVLRRRQQRPASPDPEVTLALAALDAELASRGLPSGATLEGPTEGARRFATEHVRPQSL